MISAGSLEVLVVVLEELREKAKSLALKASEAISRSLCETESRHVPCVACELQFRLIFP